MRRSFGVIFFLIFTTLKFAMAGPIEIIPDSKKSAVVYVKANASGLNDGTSWFNAFTNLQRALDSVEDSQEIWVAEGIYRTSSGKLYEPFEPNTKPTDARYALFYIKPGTRMYGGFLGHELSRKNRKGSFERTILSADIGTENDDSDNSYRVSFYQADQGGTKDFGVIDGFKITKARAGSLSGGGLITGDMVGPQNEVSKLNIQNMIFEDNQAKAGAGLLVQLHAGMIIDSIFKNNRALVSGGAVWQNMYIGANLGYLGCHFLNNYAGERGGAITRYGGSASAPRQEIQNSQFIGNTTDGLGGAIYYDSRGQDRLNGYDLTITNSVFADNLADKGGALFVMGAFELTSPDGQAYVPPSVVYAYGSTFVDNVATTKGGVMATDGIERLPGTFSAWNSILWNGPNADYYDMLPETATTTSSIVSGVSKTWHALNLNKDTDPQFIDATNYNFRLKEDSPARLHGKAFSIGIDKLDLDGDGNRTEAIPFDYDMNARDTLPEDGVVDAGAFEYRSECEGLSYFNENVTEEEIRSFVDLFLQNNDAADMDHDGFLTNGDIQVYIEQLRSRCP